MNMFRDLCAVILAAGNSSRFGNTPKQLARLNGRYLLDIVIETTIQAGFPYPTLVLGAYEKQIRPAAQMTNQCEVIVNSDWQEGMSSSLKTAVLSMKKHYDGAIFLLADQPLMTSSLLLAMASQFIREKPDILFPEYEGRKGNPVIISASLFPELLQNAGDKGGRFLFERDDLAISRFSAPDDSCLFDIDTPEDLQRLQMRFRNTNS